MEFQGRYREKHHDIQMEYVVLKSIEY